MKLEDCEAKYLIEYTPGDIPSMREALKEYGELVLSGNAFDDDYCVAHFEPSMEQLPLSYFNGHPELIGYLKGTECYREDDSDNENLRFSTLTETLFFMCAAMHPELELDMKAACEAIVAYARRVNDSSKMWINCETPFGMEPLQVTATVYPRYGYLFGAYYIPYWDDEHMPEALFELSCWSNKVGITDDTIKALCYCDNSRARENMLGYDSWDGMDVSEPIESNFDLISYFRKTPGAFETFKEQLAERYESQPFLQLHSDGDGYIENPVQNLVLDIMMTHYPYDTWDDDFDCNEYLTQRFIVRSAEEEIEEINAFIEEVLGRSIVPEKQDFIESNRKADAVGGDEDDETDCRGGQSYENWQSFITGAFENGSDIWDYINNGIDTSLPEQLRAVNIYRLAKRGEYAVFKEIDEYAIDYDDIHEEWDGILENLFRQVCAEKEGAREILLRFLDVLFRWCGQRAFDPDFISMVTGEYKLCEEKEFQQRYAVNWQMELEQAINKFSAYSSEVTREELETCRQIINRNRTDACEQLPRNLFALLPLRDEEDESSVAESLSLAVYLYVKDSGEKRDDLLTQSVKAYIEHYAIDELLMDIHDSTEFPKLETMALIEKGAPAHFQPDYIQGCREKHTDRLDFDNYIRKGVFLSNPCLSVHQAAERALSLLNENLQFDDEEISATQKQINWLRSFTDNTYKLLLVAHLGGQMENLSCTDGLKRILSLAFALAPVRVSHMLAAYYKGDEEQFENPDNLLELLETFKQQGLSDEGCWGYQMGLFSGRRDLKELRYYHLLLQEWLNANKPIPASFIAPIHRTQRMALLNGIAMLPRRTQLEIIDDAHRLFPREDLTPVYTRFFVDRLNRELRSEFRIKDVPVYFKDRLQYEGIFCKYIDWNKWNHHNDLLQKILTEVQVEKPEYCSGENCAEQLRNRKGWGYVVLQKKGDKLVPVLGSDILYFLQNGFDAENIYSAQTNALIIDETCPRERINELLELSRTDYREDWIKRILRYLTGTSQQDDVQYILRCGIRGSQFLETGNYNDVQVDDLLMKVDETIRLFALKIFGMISWEALDLRSGLTMREFYDLLVRYRVDRHAVFKLLMDKKEYSLVRDLSLKVDLSPFILKEKIADQIMVLSALGNLPQYHPLILSLEKSKSKKLQEHVRMLIERFSIKAAGGTPFHVVDYGVYTMGGRTDPQGASAQKTANEPCCINQTASFKGEAGMFFGLRFTADFPEKAPEISVHRVTVTHPMRDEAGHVQQGESSWDQNGYSRSPIFMGWYFEPDEELLRGSYHMEARDTDGNLLAEMSFEVK